METRTNWIWAPAWTAQDAAEARVVSFRKRAALAEKLASAELRISADTRYKLYVNGTLVKTGPAKGDDQVWYVDTVDVAPFLRVGENVIAVSVLRYPAAWGNHSLFRTATPGLYVTGAFSADETWRCHIDRHTSFYAEEERFAPLCIHEHAAADPEAVGWKDAAFDDSAWECARVYAADELAEPLCALTPRPIPYMKRTPHRFELPEAIIPAHTETSFVLDAGEEMTAYLSLALAGGAGAEIELLEAECYSIPTDAGYVKQNRLDSEHGELTGYRDTYAVLGVGTADAPEVYEPYWWRTFRFLRVTIRTVDEPLTLCSLTYEETGYPLEVGTAVTTSDKSLADIWDVSLRTLKRCMHETYMDCPFYEQLQYAMDTRSEILYTYAVSADDRLARQAIDDFRRAQRSDGLLNCSYPNTQVNVIPGFSIYYILMVHDHMMYFGDRALVEKNLDAIDRVLAFFDAHLTPEGLVGKVGGVNGKASFWSFIDWAREWMPTEGMPAAGLEGPLTMESLLYLCGLQAAAELAEYAGRSGEDYRVRAARLKAAIRAHCMSADGMLTDGPHRSEVSQHAQVFGILTDTLTAEEGRRNLLAAIEDAAIPQCTVAMAFYLFRALEKTGLYAYADRYWDIWRRMLANGCTTCVEAEDYARSECHAWGALALYELPSVTLGVRPAAPGYAKIAVRPVSGYLTGASGAVRTPKGDIRVVWEKSGDGCNVSIDCEDALREIIVTE